MQRLPETSFNRFVILARREPDGEWRSSTYGGTTHRIWFFSTEARPRWDQPHIIAAYLLDPGEPTPDHQTGWWAATVGMRSE